MTPKEEYYEEYDEQDENWEEEQDYEEEYEDEGQSYNQYIYQSPNLSFSEWYSIKFGQLNIIIQAFFWLTYGFVWIPLYFIISDKRRIMYEPHQNYRAQFGQNRANQVGRVKQLGAKPTFKSKPTAITNSIPPQPPPPPPPIQSQQNMVDRTTKSSSGLISLVDLNNANVDEISKLPGIGPIQARKILQVRESIGGFYSLEQFAKAMSLKPHIVEQLNELVIFGPSSPQSESGSAKKRGRVVD